MTKKQTAIRLRILAAAHVVLGAVLVGQVAVRLNAQATQPTSLLIELVKAEPVGLNGTQSDGINRFRYTFKVSNTGFVQAQNTKIRFKIPFMNDGPLPNTPVASSSSSSSSSGPCVPTFGNLCPTQTSSTPIFGGGSSSSGPGPIPVPNIAFEFAEIVNANDNSSHALINCTMGNGYVECPIGTDLFLGPNNGPGNIAPNKFLHVAMTFRDLSVSPNPRCTMDDSYQFVTTTSVTMDNQNQNPNGSTLTVEKELSCVARQQSLPDLTVRLERDPTISCDPGDSEYPTSFSSYDTLLTKYGFASYLRKPDEQLPATFAWPTYGSNKLKKVTCPELVYSREGIAYQYDPYNNTSVTTTAGRGKPISTVVTLTNRGSSVANNVRVRLVFAVPSISKLPPVGAVLDTESVNPYWSVFNDPPTIYSYIQAPAGYVAYKTGPLTCTVTGNSSMPNITDISTSGPTQITMGSNATYFFGFGPPTTFNKYVTVECKGDAPLALYPNMPLTFNVKFGSYLSASNGGGNATRFFQGAYFFATCLGDVTSDTPDQNIMDNTQVKCPTPFFDPATYSLPLPSTSSSSSSFQSSSQPVPQGTPAIVTQPNPGGSPNAPKGHIDFDAANRRFSIWSCNPTVTFWRHTNNSAWNTDITWLSVNQYSETAVNVQCGNTTNHRTRIMTFDELVNIACYGMPAGLDLDVNAYVSASVAIPIPGSPIHIKCAIPPPPTPQPSSSSSVQAPPPGPPPVPGPTQAVAGLMPGSLDTSMPEIAGWACYKPSYYGSQIYVSPGTDLNAPLKIKVYVDGPLGVGTLAQTVVANKQREPAVGNSCYNQNPYHGFSIAPAAEYCDGQPHTAYVYAFDGNLYSPLANMPKSFVCGPPVLAQNSLVLGDVTSAYPYGISGWTCANPSLNNNTDEKLRVRFYKDGPIGVGTLVQTQTVVADKPSGAAVGNVCGSFEHSFDALTSQMPGVCDGTPHQIYVYGFRGDKYAQLGSSPFTVTCQGSSSSSSDTTNGGSCMVITPTSPAPAGSILKGAAVTGNKTISGYACWWVSYNFPSGQGPNFAAPFQIRFYMNGPIGVGTLIKTVNADAWLGLGGSQTCGGNAAHGFTAVLPQNVCPSNPQASPNQVFVYAVAPNGQYQLIADPSQILPGFLCSQSSTSTTTQQSPACTIPATPSSSTQYSAPSNTSTSSSSSSSSSSSQTSVTPGTPADVAATGIELSGSPSTPPLQAGQIVRYKMTIKNVGAATAQNAGFYVSFPQLTILETYTSPGDTPCVAASSTQAPGASLFCGTAASLAGGAEYSRFVSFRVKPTATCGFQGLIGITAIMGGQDPNMNNNITTTPVSVATFNCGSSSSSSPSSSSSSISSASSASSSSAQSSSVNPNAPADLAATVLEVSGSPSTPPLYLNQVVRFKMTIQNVGGQPAQNAGFYVGFPGLTIAEAYDNGTDPPCVAAQIPNSGPGLFCGTVPSLAGGAEYTRYASFRVKPTADCGFNGLIYINTSTQDANANNNIKTAPFTTAANCASTQSQSTSSSSFSTSSAQGTMIVSDPHNPFGTHEAVVAQTIGGMACDLDNTANTVPVLLYDVTNAQTPQYLGLAQANQAGGPTVGNACGGNQNHRWTFTLPTWVCNGQPHNVKAYLLNLIGTQGTNSVANGSPRTVTCN